MALVLVLFLSLIRLGSGQWQVIGPNKPIQALAGEDVVFSCFLFPDVSAKAMEVRFFKTQVSTVVHLYRDGKDQSSAQMAAYQKRTTLIKDSITEGQVSLKMKKVALSDAGFYGCQFSSQTSSQKATWELQVTEQGSTPLISILEFVGGDLQLTCQSSGWFFQPNVKWKGSHGDDLPSQAKVKPDEYGLFSVEASLTVQENSRDISCSIQLTDWSLEVESRVLIGETFFQPSPYRLVSGLLAVLCCVLSVGIIGIVKFFSKSREQLQIQLDNVKEKRAWRQKHRQSELEEAKKYTVEVTLDPDTAHSQLYISDLKSVTYRNTPQIVPDSEKRFCRKCVVASQGFQAGKYYWEVEVGQNKRWYLGVCRDNVNRKTEHVTLSPYNGYWVFGLGNEDWYYIINPRKVILSQKVVPTRVGVFLDYEGGSISFFNINSKSHIYTLTHQFEGLLLPCIIHQPYDEKTVTPIVLCPIAWESESDALLEESPLL